jgi:hypothetical protein
MARPGRPWHRVQRAQSILIGTDTSFGQPSGGAFRRKRHRGLLRQLSSVKGTKTLGSAPVTRSFFELLDLLRLRGECGLSIERDTCFVNIVGGK